MRSRDINEMPPTRVKVWLCPACGANVTGSNYKIDETLPKCRGKKHMAMARFYWYRRE